MENNGIKNSVEKDLQEIRKCKLDVLILKRQNEELCQKNNAEIVRLNAVIENRLFQAEDDLKKSGERKIETSAGWVAFREMPDSWEYDIPKLMRWAKEDEDRKEKYIKVVEEFKKAELKKDFANGLLGHDDICDVGVTITPQEPKFNYKLNGGVF